MKTNIIRATIISTSLFFGVSVVLFSCSFAPINNQYEKAGTLKKGTMELAGSYSGYNYAGGGESGSANNNFGFRAGYGISDKFDLKLRYEKLIPSNSSDGEFDGSSNINYFSIVPKVALIPEKFSFLVPISLYIVREKSHVYTSNSNYYSIAPQVIYTFTNTKNSVDFSLGLKTDYMFSNGGGLLIVGTTAGAGFSSDLSKWAIRPEIGASFSGGAIFLSYGLGFQFLLPKNKK